MTPPHVHIPYDRIREHRAFLSGRNINLEIYLGADVLDAATPSDAGAAVAALGYDPLLTIHAPFMDLSPGAVDAKAREVTLLRFHQVLDVAEVLRPVLIVFHSGYEKWKYALKPDLWLEQSLRTWREILPRAERIGARIAVENIFEDTPDNLRMLVREMRSPSFGLCFDTGHFNLFSRVSLEEWLRQTGAAIMEYHLHDNDGTEDAHLSIGRGTFDFRALFSLMKDRTDIIRTIEAHSADGVLESLAALGNY